MTYILTDGETCTVISMRISRVNCACVVHACCMIIHMVMTTGAPALALALASEVAYSTAYLLSQRMQFRV